MQVTGARVLVTGGTRGIGRALVEGLLDADAQVAFCGRTPEGVQAAWESIRETRPERADVLTGVAGDVSLDRDAGAIVAAATAAFGGLDLLVNNAAILTPPAPVAETSTETWRDVLAVNVIGSANMIRHALPALGRARGAIINLSSGWGRTTSPGVAPYCASKFGIEALSQAVAQESEDVTCIALSPGAIATEMLATAFQQDVSDYPTPTSLVPHWLRLIAALDRTMTGQSLDLARF